MSLNDRFDAFTRVLAMRGSRRAALGYTAAGFGATMAGATRQEASAQSTPAADNAHPTFLFVQTAASGTFGPNPAAGTSATDATRVPGDGADYLLTLEGHLGGTIYFSDRPDRVFGDTPTQEFLDGFGFTPVNPPNAALVVQTDAGETDVVVLELLSPIYDESTGSITYGAVILDEYTGEGLAHVAAQQLDDELPESFGAASLFIDDCAALSQCVVFDPTVLPFGQFEFLGPIPDGPYPTCFTAGQGCSPCTTTLNALASLCNQTYEDCNVFGSNSCQPA